MGITLLGRKIGMTQIFEESGVASPVTVIEVGPCMVTQIKSDQQDAETGKSRDGYNAIQIGFEQIPESRRSYAQNKYTETTKLPAHRHHKEFRLDNAEATESYELGQLLDVNSFNEISHVDVQGTTKGRGFAGTFKRYNFTGAKESSHGSHEKFRHQGAVGMSAYPGRVIKNKKMPGHFGNESRTAINLKVAQILPEKGYLLVRGSVPGPNQGLVYIRPTER